MAPLFAHSRLVEPEQVRKSGSFTTLPVRIHERNDAADAASRQALDDWRRHVGDGQEEMSLTSISPLGNLCAFAYPEASDTRRLHIVTYMTDLGLLHDDVSEGSKEEEAFAQHADFEASFDFDGTKPSRQGERARGLKRIVAQVLLEAIAVDRERSLRMMDMYRAEWVSVVERRGKADFASLEDYYEYRMDNFGMRAFWPMVEFSMGWEPSAQDKECIKGILRPIEEALMLTNDYWSWPRERDESIRFGHRLVNAVDVVRRSQQLSEPEAQDVVRSRIIACEQEYVRQKDQFYSRTPDVSLELRRWIEQAGCILAGSHYWASSCARHHAWQDHRAAAASRRQARTASSSDTSASGGASGSPGSSVDTSPFAGSPETTWRKPDSGPLVAPRDYIRAMPSKGIRSMLIDAFNVWLCVGGASVAIIKVIIDGLHSASLILDDIEDGSLLRRGKPATHIVFGQAQAINSANYMFVEAVRAAGMLRNKDAVPLVLEALECLYLGQSWDLYYKHNNVCPTKDAYLTMVDNKTGGLFRMLLQLTVAESGCECEVNFDRLTVPFGRFFQIRDDYMNLCSTSYSEQKGFCEDLDEGKLSYPIVHMLHEDPHATEVLDVFRQHAGTTPLSVETKLRILDRLRQSGSLRHTLQYLWELELECEEEICRLERCFGEPNPLLRLVLVKLSMREVA